MGSAPKHVEQFQKEGHLRWDSLGEFLALAVSLEEIAVKTGSAKVAALAAALNAANERFLDAHKNPSRRVREFEPVARALAEAEATVSKELIDCQGSKVEVGGYWKPDDAKAFEAMRPSRTLNDIISTLEEPDARTF